MFGMTCCMFFNYFKRGPRHLIASAKWGECHIQRSTQSRGGTHTLFGNFFSNNRAVFLKKNNRLKIRNDVIVTSWYVTCSEKKRVLPVSRHYDNWRIILTWLRQVLCYSTTSDNCLVLYSEYSRKGLHMSYVILVSCTEKHSSDRSIDTGEGGGLKYKSDRDDYLTNEGAPRWRALTHASFNSLKK